MGGYGSGLYGSGGMKSKTPAEACRSIDIRRWQQGKVLKPKSAFTWGWFDDSGETVASISVIVHKDYVTLAYNVNGQPIRADILIAETKTGFGQRKWFYCPICSNKAAILYVRGRIFKCRKCHNLTYRSSQLSGDMQYYHRQLEKLSRLLGADYDATSSYPPDKPKGMHWKTYERHAQRYLELVEKREEAFMKGAQAVMKRFYKQD